MLRRNELSFVIRWAHLSPSHGLSAAAETYPHCDSYQTSATQPCRVIFHILHPSLLGIASPFPSPDCQMLAWFCFCRASSAASKLAWVDALICAVQVTPFLHPHLSYELLQPPLPSPLSLPLYLLAYLSLTLPIYLSIYLSSCLSMPSHFSPFAPVLRGLQYCPGFRCVGFRCVGFRVYNIVNVCGCQIG